MIETARTQVREYVQRHITMFPSLASLELQWDDPKVIHASKTKGSTFFVIYFRDAHGPGAGAAFFEQSPNSAQAIPYAAGTTYCFKEESPRFKEEIEKGFKPGVEAFPCN